MSLDREIPPSKQPKAPKPQDLPGSPDLFTPPPPILGSDTHIVLGPKDSLPDGLVPPLPINHEARAEYFGGPLNVADAEATPPPALAPDPLQGIFTPEQLEGLPSGYMPVESSNIKAVGFFEASNGQDAPAAPRLTYVHAPETLPGNPRRTGGRLEVMFHNGKRWAYQPVTPYTMRQMLEANSVGAYFNEYIKKDSDVQQYQLPQ